MNTIDKEINVALKLAEKNTEDYAKYCNIYPWTNEELGGVFNNFCHPNSKVLTICSSGDHVLNAILCGSTDITAFDINKFTFYYLDLKMAAIESFSRKEFIKFMPGLLSKREYIANLYQRGITEEIYSLESILELQELIMRSEKEQKEYRKDLFTSQLLLQNLKNISIESYNFWTELYNRNKDIMDSYMFKTHSCGHKNTIIYCANYFKSNKDYKMVKNNLSKVNIIRHWTNIKELPKKINKKHFDFIHFSNIADVSDTIFPVFQSSFVDGLIMYSKFLKSKIYPLLNDDGAIVINRITNFGIDNIAALRDYTMEYAFTITENPYNILDLPQGDRVYYKKM